MILQESLKKYQSITPESLSGLLTHKDKSVFVLERHQDAIDDATAFRDYLAMYFNPNSYNEETAGRLRRLMIQRGFFKQTIQGEIRTKVLERQFREKISNPVF